jgi:hypothetical protein
MTQMTQMTQISGVVLRAAIVVGVLDAAQTLLPFTSVQPEVLGVPHSYSNAWGDFDSDGDVDLAVSLGTGEVRLYRNDKGVLASVGADGHAWPAVRAARPQLGRL